MPQTWATPQVDDNDLYAVEERLVDAIERRSVDGLNLIGFGELGVAIGWPTEEPTHVFKRQAPGEIGSVERERRRMLEYQDALRSRGALVLPDQLKVAHHHAGRAVLYVVQPMVEPERLAEHIFERDEPDPEHPVLCAIRDTVRDIVSDTSELGLSIDAQVTNFAWDDARVVSLDTTPPLLWDASSGPFYDVGNYLDGLPSLLMPAVRPKLRSTGDRYRTVRSTLRQTSIYFKRIDQDRWVDASIRCFNQVIEEPLERGEVDTGYERMIKDIPLIKNIARVERFWVERIRRRRYEFFITNSFTGEIL